MSHKKLTIEALKKMGFRIAIVILITTGITYFHFLASSYDQTVSQLHKYINERGQRERVIFQLAEKNLDVAKQEFLKRYDSKRSSEYISRFDKTFVKYQDGITRLKPEYVNHKEKATVSIGVNADITDDLKQRVLIFEDITNQFGPAWHHTFQDTYFTTPENVIVVYWPESAWGQETTPDLDMTKEEYVSVANLQNNPQRKLAWTGVFLDTVSGNWMMSVANPIDVSGKWLATVGHDVMLSELITRTSKDVVPGTYNIIIQRDGRLIYSPNELDAIKQVNGKYSVQDAKDPYLAEVYEIVKPQRNSSAVLDHPVTKDLLAVTHIPEPDWYLVTVFPRALIVGPAKQGAQAVLLLGLAALLLELLILARVLKNSVAIPLQQLAEATKKLSEGNFEVTLDLHRDDEIGRLGQSFNAMSKSIKERDLRLANTNQELELEVKKRTQEFEQEAQRAQAAAKAKSDFLANMSHEIRTPLNGILGMTDLVLETDLNSEAKEYLGTIRHSGEVLLSIINDILDFSKIEAGCLSINVEEFEVRSFIQSVEKTFAVLAESKSLIMVTKTEDDVPKILVSDSLRIGQILNNLLGNAIKFTSEGAIFLNVFVESRSEDKLVIGFGVSDTGIGIASDNLEKVFEAFSQEDASTTRRFGGTGLGLAICRNLVGMMGGMIKASSKQGLGSGFSFSIECGLPREDVTSADKVAEANDIVSQKSNIQSLQGMSVLLVEDNIINQKLAEKILSKRGATVSLAINGLEALQMVKQGKFNAILMDCQMPVMGGLEATTHIRAFEKENGGHVPIIAMTARAITGDREECLNAGMDDYISKPFRIEDLLIVLGRYIPKKPSESTLKK